MTYWICDDTHDSFRTVLGGSFTKVSDDRCICVEQVISRHSWVKINNKSFKFSLFKFSLMECCGRAV